MPRMSTRLFISPPSDSSRYQPLRSSQLTVPPSPTSPRTPLQPPARLHLRPMIPSSPLSPSFITRAPDTPYPWIWRCHVCNSVYSLGVTRRCLEDGHFFCSLPFQITPSTPSDSLKNEPLSAEELAQKSKEERRKRKQKPRQACRSEFDYAGWNKYNIWRREICIIQAEKNRTSDIEGDPYLPNCWMECDFPSECHNTRLERLRAMRKAVELSRDRPHFNSLEWDAQAVEIEAKIENMLDDSPPIDILSLPSTQQKGGLEIERVGLAGEADLVGISVVNVEGLDLEDDMGLKEVEFVRKKRKKSIQKIRQLTGLSLDTATEATEATPPSPLKMQFAPEDMEDVDLGEGESKKIYPQMEGFSNIGGII